MPLVRLADLPIFNNSTVGSFVTLIDPSTGAAYKAEKDTLLTGSFDGTSSFAQVANYALTTNPANTVTSFNTRAGAVTLQSTDIAGLGAGILSSSTFSSPSQGTLRATINGLQTDVDLGLQTGDSVSFFNVTGSNALFTGNIIASTLVVQTVTSSIIYSSGSNTFGNKMTDVQQVTGSLRVTGSVTVTGGNFVGNLDGNSSTVTNGVYTTGDQTIGGTKTFTSTIAGSINGNAATVTNGVYTNGSYADPSWITSLAGSKISGNISGNAANITAYTINQNLSTTSSPTFSTVTAALTGNASTATVVNGTSGQNTTKDDRIIEPNSITSGRMQFGFTSWANNNGSPYADYLHLRSYTDSSGGNDNLVMFRKDAIGMRIWQQTWDSATAYSSYKDVAWTDGTNATGTWGISITGNAGTATTWATARTLTIGSTGKSVNGSADVTWTLSEIGAAATNQTMHIGTTAVAINRGSAALSLTGVSIDGNAGTVTNGVYTTGDQTIGGNKTFSSTITGSISGNANSSTYSIYLGAPTDSIDAEDISTRKNSGFYQSNSPGAGWPSGASSWWHMHTTTHSNGANYYAMQLAASFFSQGLWYRSTNGSGTTVWSQVVLNTGTWGISITGNAGTATTWATARTLTIGSTGKSVNGSADVTWTLGEIGAAATNQTMHIGTTAVAINRGSAALSLTGVSIDGNSGTVTNGVYTTGDQTIGGTKTFSSTVSVANTNPVLILKDTDNSGTGIGQTGYISFHDSGNVERAWMGYGSAGSNNLTITNGKGDVVLSPSTSNAYVGANIILHAGNINSYAVALSGDQTIGGTKTFTSTIAGSINGNAATVTINDSASPDWYDLVWRSGNTLFRSTGTGGEGGVQIYAAGNYIRCQYLNTTDDVSNGNISSIVAKFGDNYHRSATAAKVAAFISGQSMNISGTATNITAYTINQNLGTSSGPTFAGITSTANINLNSNELRIGSTSTYHSIEVGVGRTGNGFAYIDLIGDTTYDDFGLRIMRGDGGSNTYSILEHRGTGDFIVETNDQAALVFNTWGTTRAVVQSDGDFRPGADNTYKIGTPSYRWYEVYSAIGTINTSDAREKKDISDSDLGLDFITKLRPVSFKMKKGRNIETRKKVMGEDGKEKEEAVFTPTEGKMTHYGLIAQEVKAVIGEKNFAGYVEEEGIDTLGLRYTEFIAPMIKAIQEQQAQIEALKAEIAALKNP